MHNPGRDLASVAADATFNNPFYSPPYMLEDYYFKGAFISDDIDFGRSICQLKVETEVSPNNGIPVKYYTFDISKELADGAKPDALKNHQRNPSSITQIQFSWPTDSGFVGVDNKTQSTDAGATIAAITRFERKDNFFIKDVSSTNQKNGSVAHTRIEVNATGDLATIHAVTSEFRVGKKGQSFEQMELRERYSCANATF